MSTHTIEIEPVLINAPAETVWEILTDLPSYPEWNPFTVRADSSLRIGEGVDLYIPSGKEKKLSKQSFVLEVLDPPHQIAWRLPKLIHKKLLNAYRVQTVRALDSSRSSYHTSDTFDGWLAGKIYQARGEWVRKNFVRLAEALKERAETLSEGAR